MNKNIKINEKEIDNLYDKLHEEAKSSGYHLNHDVDFTKDLISGLLVNQQRYGYWACPCRLASGDKSEDLDIICPCDYRDADLNEYGTCYCSLYVSKKILESGQEIKSIPERRPLKDKQAETKTKPKGNNYSLSKPVYRCKVCGYLCGRDEPPEVCPICKAKKERFERFM